MRSGLLAFLALAAFACSGVSRLPKRVLPSRETDLPGLEDWLADRVDEERERRGLDPLARDPALSRVAKAHSGEMLALGFFGHESPVSGDLAARLLGSGVSYREARENVAMNSSLEGAHDSLVASRPHRENLLAPRVERLGVGIAVGEMDGRTVFFVTEIFLDP